MNNYLYVYVSERTWRFFHCNNSIKQVIGFVLRSIFCVDAFFFYRFMLIKVQSMQVHVRERVHDRVPLFMCARAYTNIDLVALE